jgi:hypothetical protein
LLTIGVMCWFERMPAEAARPRLALLRSKW